MDNKKAECHQHAVLSSPRLMASVALGIIAMLSLAHTMGHSLPAYGRSQTRGRTVKANASSGDQPLPDINSLLAEVQANQKAIDQIRENYTYKKLEEEMELDGRGQIKKKHAREQEIFYVNGHEIQKLIASDGRGLSGTEVEREQQRVEKEVSRYTSADPKPVPRREEEDEDELHISTFLRAAKFTQPRWESFHGQDVIALDIEPNPSYHPQNLNERLVQKLEGVMWIDQRAHQVVRLEAHLGSTAKIGGGLLGSIAQGSAAIFEQSLVNNEVWLPSYLEEHLSGRFLLFSRYRRDFVIHYKDYKSSGSRFTARSGHRSRTSDGRLRPASGRVVG